MTTIIPSVRVCPTFHEKSTSGGKWNIFDLPKVHLCYFTNYAMAKC